MRDWTGGAVPSRHLSAARSARHFAGVEAARADLHLGNLAVDQRADDLQVWLPGATGLVVRVGDVVPVRDALVAVVAAIACDGHGLLRLRDELDARHVSAVSLAEAGLQDARVTAVPRCEAGADDLEKLVGGF